MRHNQTRIHLHRKCVNVVTLNQPSKSSMTGLIDQPPPLHHLKRYVKLRATLPAALRVGMAVTSLLATVGVINTAIVLATAALISAQPAQNHKRHVKLLATVAAALVEIPVTSLLANVGVIITAIVLATAAPISAQPAQKSRKMKWPKRCKACLTKPDNKPTIAQPHPRPQAVQQPAMMDAVLETTARLTQAATVM